MSETLYLATEKNVKVSEEAVALGDIAQLSCSDARILAKASALRVMQIPKGQYGRYVVRAITLITLVQKHMGQVDVVHVGEPEFLVTFGKPETGKRLWPWVKTGLVCLVTFFGSAFSIMTFNTDVDVSGLFERIYRQVTGSQGDGFSVLEAAYSAGIGLGVIFFFNHFGPRKLTQDPTPMEVEMRVYEDQVNATLAAQTDRGGEEGREKGRKARQNGKAGKGGGS